MGIRKAAVAWQVYRVAHQCVVKLHPRVFREQFGEEMMWIFEEAAETHGALRLLGDGVISLARRWILRPRPSNVALAEAASSALHETGLFAWEHIGTSPSRLPAGRWLQGGLMSLTLFTGVWLAANQVGKRMAVTSFGADSDSALRTPGLTPATSQNGGANSTLGGGHASGVYALVKPQDLRERQQRQQQLAVQVAAGAQIIPGATLLAVESQGLVPEVPKTPAGEQFSAWLRGFNSGERAQLEEARSHCSRFRLLTCVRLACASDAESVLPLPRIAGTKPQRSVATIVQASAYNTTLQSSRISSTLGSSEARERNTLDVAAATNKPRVAPKKASRKTSVSSCITMAEREAPSEKRTAISCWRCVARARSNVTIFRACDQQKQRHRSKQHPQGATRLANRHLLERFDLHG